MRRCCESFLHLTTMPPCVLLNWSNDAPRSGVRCGASFYQIEGRSRLLHEVCGRWDRKAPRLRGADLMVDAACRGEHGRDIHAQVGDVRVLLPVSARGLHDVSVNN